MFFYKQRLVAMGFTDTRNGMGTRGIIGFSREMISGGRAIPIKWIEMAKCQ
jgi:hypothetical protein